MNREANSAKSVLQMAKILRGWAIDKVQKRLAEALNRSEKQKEDTGVSFRKKFTKNTRAVSVGSRARLNQAQTLCW